MRLPDDALSELWTLYDASGIRPEYVLPVLYFESGFNPAIANDAGAPYYGIGQDYGPYLARHGLSPADYMGLSAAAQIREVVAPRLTELARHFGTPRSATRVYQANFLPGTMGQRALFSPLVGAGSSIYQANAFDWAHRGAITIADLAHAMGRSAASAEVKDAIARAYTQRTGETPREAVFGEDYAGDPWPAIVLLVATAAGALFR